MRAPKEHATSLSAWTKIVSKYAQLYNDIIIASGEPRGTVAMLNSTFDAKGTYAKALEETQDEESSRRNIVMEFIAIRNVTDAVVRFLIPRGYDVIFVSPDIWYPTWLISSNPYREEPTDEGKIAKYEEAERQIRDAMTYETDARSFFSVTSEGSLTALGYKGFDTIPFVDMGHSVLDSGGVKVASRDNAFDFLTKVGYVPISYAPVEREFMPKAWKGTDKDDDVIFYIHSVAMKRKDEEEE